MKPFFDSFAGLIGDGGDAFQNKVLPYAKQLGKFIANIRLHREVSVEFPFEIIPDSK